MNITKFIFLFIFALIINRANSNNDTKKIIIFVHSEYKYPLISYIWPKKKKKLITKRWKAVQNFNAEKRGLIDITNLSREMFSQSNDIIYNIKEKYKAHNAYFYLYNWDGSTNKKDLYKSSLRLAQEIVNLKEKYHKFELILIGFSHGGNIISQSSTLPPIQKHNIHYEKVVLLGTPIGKKTEKWVSKKKPRGDYIIKSIYVASSRGDYTQIKDFLFNFPFCSKFITTRKTRVHNFYVYFEHLDKFKTNIFFYHPNHQNFWHYNKLELKGKSFNFYPITYYILDIINKDYINKLFNQKNKEISYIGILI